jgi:hypothetical protein
MRRLLTILLVVGLLASCGGDASAPEVPQPKGAPPPLHLPVPLEAEPVLAVVFKETPTHEQIGSVRDISEVRALSTMSIGEVAVESPGGSGTMTVGAVDPITYRPNAPEATRDADFVWTALLRDDAAVTFDAAAEMGLGGAASITLGAAGRVDVGAYADNGVPNLADILVNQTIGRKLGLDEERLVVIGQDPEGDTTVLQEKLENALAGEHIVNLLPQISSLMSASSPELGAGGTSLIPTMDFTVLNDGFIKPDKEWVKQNITTAQVPIIGEVTCHRVMIPRLFAALAEIEQQGLAELIRPGDYGGCYVPRFIDRNPDLPLSMHAFGLAADLNVSTNLLGSEGDMDPRVVAIFEKWGFTWGGVWDRPDPMHFELTRLVDV